MILHFKDYLFLEAVEEKKAVMAFGRFNPISIGHEKLIKKISNEAAKHNAVGIIFLSHSQDNKKNPLSYERKCFYIKKILPSNVKLIETPARNLNEIFKVLQAMNFKHIFFVAGSDRVMEFTKWSKYKQDYNFETFDVISAGERDPDDEGVSGISGTKLRQFVKDNDINSFCKYVPGKIDCKAMFKDVQNGLK